MWIALNGRVFAKKELSALLQTIRLLTEDAQDALQDFVASPYFTKEIGMAPLYEKILAGHRTMVVSKQSAYRINGKNLLEAMNLQHLTERAIRKKLRSLLKQLPDLILEFVEHQELKNNQNSGGKFRIKGLQKWKAPSFFEEAAGRYEEWLKNEKMTLMQQHDSWWLHHQRYFFQYADQYDPQNKAYFIQAIEHSYACYQLTTLRYYCEVKNRSRILGKEEEFTALSNRAGEFINTDSPRPIVALYSRLVRFLQFPKKQQLYESFKSHYQLHAGELAKSDQLVMIKSTFNELIRLYEWGVLHSPSELVIWAKEGLSTGALMYKNTPSDREYLNIISAAGIAEEFDFMESFRENYKEYLEEHIRERAYPMAMIYSNFFRLQLHEVIQLLRKHFPMNYSFGLIYTLRVKVFYILSYLMCSVVLKEDKLDGDDCQEELIEQLERYRQYINRADILDEERRTPYKRFHNICKRIYKHATESIDAQTKANKAVLLNEIEAEKPLLARYFLKRIVEKLKAR